MLQNKQITVKDMVLEYLKTNGYDGLAGEDCCCELSDLMSVCEYSEKCVAGHKVTCKECEKNKECKYRKEMYFREPYSWCMVSGKREVNNATD